MTGFVHLRARDYDPVTGQFVSVDPAVDETRQPYAYTGNSPVSRTDPSGLDWWKDWNAWRDDFQAGVAAFGVGVADSLSGGASTELLRMSMPEGAADCFLDGRTAAFAGGQVVGVVVEVASYAVAIVTTGAAGVGYVAARVAAKVAAKAAVKRELDDAAEATAAAVVRTDGEDIALGLRSEGLQRSADQLGSMTLLKDANWRSTLQNAVSNPSQTFSVMLDGLAGGSTYSQVMGGVQRAAAGIGSHTDWEFGLLHSAGRLGDVRFYLGGNRVANPFE